MGNGFVKVVGISLLTENEEQISEYLHRISACLRRTQKEAMDASKDSYRQFKEEEEIIIIFHFLLNRRRSNACVNAFAERYKQLK